MSTILIMAGGTGGHVFPGLAVAAALREQGWRVVWLGTQSGMEVKLVAERGYEMEIINFSGLRGKSAVTWLTLPLRILRAFWQSAGVMRRVQPDVVLGMGGYPAFPGGMMAVLFNKPLLIHEQNSVAGLTNKVLAKIADKILLGFPDAIRNGDVTVTGNPVRAEIAALSAPEKRYAARSGELRLLVIGGSLGAQALNAAVPQALRQMPAALRPQVTHQAGAKNLDALQKNYAEAGVAGELLAFIDNMAERYAECDLVICRAGAATIAELAAAGVASVLVPFPHAVDDHQTHNAKFLSEQGAAVLLPQAEIGGLAQLLMSFSREKCLDMAVKARSLAKPGATDAVARQCMESVKA